MEINKQYTFENQTLTYVELINENGWKFKFLNSENKEVIVDSKLFYSTKPFPSWVVDKEGLNWIAPKEMPVSEGKYYT
jgi:hypothetical protein